MVCRRRRRSRSTATTRDTVSACPRLALTCVATLTTCLVVVWQTFCGFRLARVGPRVWRISSRPRVRDRHPVLGSVGQRFLVLAHSFAGWKYAGTSPNNINECSSKFVCESIDFAPLTTAGFPLCGRLSVLCVNGDKGPYSHAVLGVGNNLLDAHNMARYHVSGSFCESTLVCLLPALIPPPLCCCCQFQTRSTRSGTRRVGRFVPPASVLPLSAALADADRARRTLFRTRRT